MDRLAPALRASSARVIELVRSTPDIDVTVPASPRWNVLQTLRHLVNVTPRFVAGPQGGGTWADEPPALAGINDDELSGLGELRLPDLIVEFQDAVEDVIRRVGRFATVRPPGSGGNRWGGNGEPENAFRLSVFGGFVVVPTGSEPVSPL